MITQAAQTLVNSDMPSLGFINVPPSHFNNDPIQVRQSIYDFHAWAAIVINANATALLRAAITEGNSSYDPMGALQVIYVQARDDSTIDNYIMPMLSSFQSDTLGMFGSMWTKTVSTLPKLNSQSVDPYLNAGS